MLQEFLGGGDKANFVYPRCVLLVLLLFLNVDYTVFEKSIAYFICLIVLRTTTKKDIIEFFFLKDVCYLDFFSLGKVW
jgi:hypothetical protein